jgi:26S proteasome regulatory subunit N10
VPFLTKFDVSFSIFFFVRRITTSMDNSEYMRNSDYTPTRLEAQQDAAGVISNSKINSNPENTVGVLSMAGKGVELLVSPTEDSGKILACFGQVRPEGMLNFSAGVKVAQLALKHRKNKNGGQRLIIFVGSPIKEDVNALQKVGKLLKKNNVAVNVVSMGELDDNNEKLTEFINAVNSNDNSSFVVVPPGVLPQDAIMSSPIMEGGVGVASGGAGSGMQGGASDFGIDESMDPELAMAMRVSMEEARAAAAAAEGASGGGGDDTAPASGTDATVQAPSSFGGTAAADEEDEDALMQQALALSMQSMTTDASAPAPAPAAAVTDTATATATTPAAADVSGSFVGMGGDEEDEDALMQQALALSMATGTQPPAPPAAGDTGAGASASSTSEATPAGGGGGKPSFLNPEFVKQLFGENDVDLNDPVIQAALEQLEADTKAQKDDGATGGKKRKGDDV